MDIHRPKAAHSWREFLIEIGTIICGILIALGLEQAVEAAHRAGEVREAREALHAEMEQNLSVAQTWKREHPCWQGALDAAKAWSAGTAPRPAFPTGLMNAYSSSVWDMTRGGAVTHMTLDEKLALASFYDNVATDTAVIEKHRDMATDIGGYLARDRLTPREAADLDVLIGRLRWVSKVEVQNAEGILRKGAAAKLVPAPENPSRTARIDAFCATFAPKA